MTSWSQLFVLSLHLTNIAAASFDSGFVNPCSTTRCEKISTELMSKHQYNASKRKYQHTDHPDTPHGSWMGILRKRRRKKLPQQQRGRIKRSPTRTIVSVNTEYQTLKKNKKCHKYAMFKVSVSKYNDDGLSQQAHIRCPVAKNTPYLFNAHPKQRLYRIRMGISTITGNVYEWSSTSFIKICRGCRTNTEVVTTYVNILGRRWRWWVLTLTKPSPYNIPDWPGYNIVFYDHLLLVLSIYII